MSSPCTPRWGCRCGPAREFGAPEVGQVYARAPALCQQVEETPHSSRYCRDYGSLMNCKGSYRRHGTWASSYDLGPACPRGRNSCWWPTSVLGDTLVSLGDFVGARVHLEQGFALYNPQQHRSHAFLYGYDSGGTASPLGHGRCGILAIRTTPYGESTTRCPSPRLSHPLASPLPSPLRPGSITAPGSPGRARAGRGTDCPRNRPGVCILGTHVARCSGLAFGRGGTVRGGIGGDAPGHSGLAGDGSGAATALLSCSAGEAMGKQGKPQRGCGCRPKR